MASIAVKGLRPPICASNFSKIGAHILYVSYSLFCKVCKMTKKIKKKKRNFYQNLLTHILEILFKFGMWPPLHGGKLHCKFGAIWKRHRGATDAWKLRLCFDTHSVCAPPFFGPHDILLNTSITYNKVVCINQFCSNQFTSNGIRFVCSKQRELKNTYNGMLIIQTYMWEGCSYSRIACKNQTSIHFNKEYPNWAVNVDVWHIQNN